MSINERLEAFVLLGGKLKNLTGDELEGLCVQARGENPWFTADSVKSAIQGLGKMLDRQSLEHWLNQYKIQDQQKIVGLVMAGNIPMVGFHDLLCTLASGNIAKAKLSSQDSALMKYLSQELLSIEPRLGEQLMFTDQLKNIDAIIATGSDNSSRYFEYYFSKYPHIIRKNRTSCAILQEDDKPEELTKLGEDIFKYYGLGCRNVSKLYVPTGYKFDSFFESIETYADISNHHKYCNNYDYNKSIYLVNGEPHFDNGFLLLRKDNALVSPISVIFYEEYSDHTELNNTLSANKDKIQCIVSNNAKYLGSLAFGQAQFPAVDDYADNVDTMKFLTEL